MPHHINTISRSPHSLLPQAHSKLTTRFDDNAAILKSSICPPTPPPPGPVSIHLSTQNAAETFTFYALKIKEKQAAIYDVKNKTIKQKKKKKRNENLKKITYLEEQYDLT
jgi:hypothetical protein